MSIVFFMLLLSSKILQDLVIIIIFLNKVDQMCLFWVWKNVKKGNPSYDNFYLIYALLYYIFFMFMYKIYYLNFSVAGFGYFFLMIIKYFIASKDTKPQRTGCSEHC